MIFRWTVLPHFPYSTREKRPYVRAKKEWRNVLEIIRKEWKNIGCRVSVPKFVDLGGRRHPVVNNFPLSHADMCHDKKSRSKILKVPRQVYVSGSWVPKVPCQVYISGSWVSGVPRPVYISGSRVPKVPRQVHNSGSWVPKVP